MRHVDDHAGGALANDADVDVAGDQADNADDAVDDVVDDDTEADPDRSIILINSNVRSTIINTSRFVISNIKMGAINSIKNTIRMIVKR